MLYFLFLLAISVSLCVLSVQTKLKIIKLFWSLSEMITRNNCIYACPVLIASFARLAPSDLIFSEYFLLRQRFKIVH